MLSRSRTSRMKNLIKAGCLVLISSFFCSASTQSQIPAMGEVLAQLRSNVIHLRDTLPDFVCSEKITSRILENGKIDKEKVIDSLFTWTRKAPSEPSKESREVLAIN